MGSVNAISANEYPELYDNQAIAQFTQYSPYDNKFNNNYNRYNNNNRNNYRGNSRGY